MALPMCRSRTDDFLALRGRVRRGPPPRLDVRQDGERLEEGYGMLPRDCPFPEWVDHLEDIRDAQSRLQKSISSLDSLYKKASQLTTLFSSNEENQREIHVLCKEITTQFRQNQSAIRRLEGMSKGLPPEECKVVSNAEKSCVAELANMNKQFRQIQKDYMERERRNKSGSHFQKDEELAQWEAEDREVRQEEALMSEAISDEQRHMIRLNEELATQRDSELQDIVKSINDVHEIFQDLNTMVIDQGTMLDRIDHNISKAQKSVETGVTELRKAVKSSKNTKFKYCVVLLLCLITLFLIALVARKS